ncbi:MAG TPA: hypothetical protein DCE41_02365 [Cytophagales bacterium]|nr:hypothetical protein [Cytophagales bacterium]HAP59396.1 hypothetical protein [Cytophagales bacterium]
MTTNTLASGSRLQSLDVIRGIAILGILLMNIQVFSMIGQAYGNPTAYGDFSGANRWVWIFSHVLADQKFMTIFSLLFGASMMLIIQGAQRKERSALGLHYRRNFWLLIIGLAHAYLIWYGDILTPYALCALLLYPAYKLSPKAAIIIGAILFTVPSVLETSLGLSMPYWPQEEILALQGDWLPRPELVQREISAYQGSMLEQLNMRAHTAFMLQTTVMPLHILWRVLGLMLMGMALFKTGFLGGGLSIITYRRTALWAGLPGLALVLIGVVSNLQANFDITYSMLLGSQWNYWGSLGMALAYISLIILWVKSPAGQKLKARFSAVGRMALSNYLIQSLIGAFIFYGLGLFGEVSRVGQFLVVLGIWALQLTYSPWWMARFHYGPFEWAWRSLTQGKRQPWLKMRSC